MFEPDGLHICEFCTNSVERRCPILLEHEHEESFGIFLGAEDPNSFDLSSILTLFVQRYGMRLVKMAAEFPDLVFLVPAKG